MLFMKKIGASSILLALLLVLTGCAGNPMRQYDDELKETVTLVKTGSVKQALENLEKNNTPGAISKDKDILYYFEKGELLNLGSDYSAGRDAWLKADEVVQQWEDTLKTHPEKLLGDIGSYLVNDKTRRYDGQDYEKVMLSTRLTLNHIMLGNYDHARIEMKKTYEREKLIEAFRDKEYDKLKEESEKQQVSSDLKQMKDYPMAELDTPEVRELKNGFQNAFSHYLAGYFFEVTGETSLAEPGYRNALQLAPNKRIIQAGLQNVGRRKPAAKESDVLFVLESGFAPAWKSITIPIPLPQQNGLVVTPLSFPIIKSVGKVLIPPSLSVAGRQLPVETLTSVDTMSRRLLKDQMPGILMRTVVRAVAKSVVQKQAQKAGIVGGLIATVATVVSEQADERSWRTLPDAISIARATLPHGRQTLEFQSGAGTYKAEVDIGNRFTIIPIRITGGAVYVGQPNVMGSMVQEVLADTEIRSESVPETGKKNVRKKAAPKEKAKQ
jgi:hypothetical protein